MGANLRRISYSCLKFSIFGGLVAAIALLPYGWVRSQEERQPNACAYDVETLTSWMLADLPSYANRVIQRSRRTENSLYSYVIITGKAEFEPIAFTYLQYQPVLIDTAQQVFFTTLERQYSTARATDLQNYYWLFLTQTSEGWRLVMLFSQLASLEPGTVPLPPQDATNGAIGQAIALWLRDCRAGVLSVQKTK